MLLRSDRANPLLRLSPKTRRRIYEFMGVAATEHVAASLVFNLHRNHHISATDKPVKRHLGFHGLLLSCRTIYKEAAGLLYAENIFVIHSSPGPSDPLLALTGTALGSLTCLKVVLNHTSCHQETSGGDNVADCCLATDELPSVRRSWCERTHSKAHQPPLRSTDPSALSLLLKWEAAARHLSEIPQDRLTLFFVCDVDHGDVEAGKLALAPLLTLPRLKGCHVRLGNRPDFELQNLVDEVVQKCLGLVPLPRTQCSAASSSQVASHFLDLPRELRLRILGFTNLVTPIKEVSWDGQAYRANRPTYSMRHQAGYNNDLHISCRRDHHHGCRFNNCWLECITPGNYHAGCFCRLQHTAVSSHCRCWAPPTDLFLVCRTLYYEAQHVFFSTNRFIVHDYGDMLDPDIIPSLPWVDTYPNTRLTASRFLRDQVPPNSLASLRFLELVFPAYMHHSWPSSPDHPAITDWVDTVKYVNDKINGPGLTLRVITINPPGTPPVGHDRLTVDQGRQIEQAYHNILSPLARFQDSRRGPLHRFYAHLAYPWAYTEDTMTMMATDVQKYYAFIRSQENRLKEAAEKMVLGDDRYYKKMSFSACSTRLDPLEAPEPHTGDDSDAQSPTIDYFHEVSHEVLNKPLEVWEREEREGKEPRISYWHFCHEVMRSSG